MITKQALKFAALGAFAVGFMAASGAEAAVFSESGDASRNRSGAQDVGTVANGDIIRGRISNGDDGDVYRFDIGAGSTLVSITAIDTTQNSFDPEIFLFTAWGAPLEWNDDSGSVINGSIRNSLITTSLGAGSYLIGIGDYDMRALDVGGNNNDAWDGGTPPNDFGRFRRLDNHSFISTGKYDIIFGVETTAVAEPAALGLFGLGLVGLGLAARRRTKV